MVIETGKHSFQYKCAYYVVSFLCDWNLWFVEIAKTPYHWVFVYFKRIQSSWSHVSEELNKTFIIKEKTKYLQKIFKSLFKNNMPFPLHNSDQIICLTIMNMKYSFIYLPSVFRTRSLLTNHMKDLNRTLGKKFHFSILHCFPISFIK